MSENPLDSLSEVELFNTTLMLGLICGRNKAVLPHKRRQYLCSLGGLLVEQANNKGYEPCLAPYHVGRVKKI
jgi:hypothetical protein